jgi:hypothetical protein
MSDKSKGRRMYWTPLQRRRDGEFFRYAPLRLGICTTAAIGDHDILIQWANHHVRIGPTMNEVRNAKRS